MFILFWEATFQMNCDIGGRHTVKANKDQIEFAEPEKLDSRFFEDVFFEGLNHKVGQNLFKPVI